MVGLVLSGSADYMTHYAGLKHPPKKTKKTKTSKTPNVAPIAPSVGPPNARDSGQHTMQHGHAPMSHPKMVIMHCAMLLVLARKWAFVQDIFYDVNWRNNQCILPSSVTGATIWDPEMELATLD